MNQRPDLVVVVDPLADAVMPVPGDVELTLASGFGEDEVEGGVPGAFGAVAAGVAAASLAVEEGPADDAPGGQDLIELGAEGAFAGAQAGAGRGLLSWHNLIMS